MQNKSGNQRQYQIISESSNQPFQLFCHYPGHGSGIQAVYKEKTTLLNRLDSVSMHGKTTTSATETPDINTRGWLKIFSSPLAGEEARRAGEGYPTEKLYSSPSFGLRPLFPSEGRRVHGFTLIELLVVVLIIGVLSAIAVPQYQKSVEKSKASQALILLRSAHQAAVAYYMANGTSPNSFEEMGFEIPWTGTEKWCASAYAIDTRSNGEWSLQLFNNYNTNQASSIYMGRLNGKYKGAGLIVHFVNGGKVTSTGDIRCAERISTGITFDTNLSAGDYCIKIMNATPNTTSTATTFRSYKL